VGLLSIPVVCPLDLRPGYGGDRVIQDQGRTRNELECAATCITIDAAATHRHKFLLDCIEVLVRCAGTPKGVDGTGSGKFVASLGPELALNLIYAKLRESVQQCF
jgi:hypothetical protein